MSDWEARSSHPLLSVIHDNVVGMIDSQGSKLWSTVEFFFFLSDLVFGILGSRFWAWSVLECWVEFFGPRFIPDPPPPKPPEARISHANSVSWLRVQTCQVWRSLGWPKLQGAPQSWKVQNLWKFIQNFWVETPPLRTLTLLYFLSQDVPNWGIQWGSRGCLPTRWRHVRGRTGAVEHVFCARRWERKTCLGGDPEK